MASYDDIFGNNSGSGVKYIKWSAVDEALYFVVTGEPDPKYPDYDFKANKRKYLVKYAAEPKYKLKLEGEFVPDAGDVENYFGLTVLRVPVTVFRKVKPNGEDDEAFEAFDSHWIPTQDQMEKLKDQMLETKIPLSEGTIVAVKYLMDGKPKKYMVRLAEGE